MSTRIKPKILIPKTREEAESILGEITDLKIFQEQTMARMNERLKEVRDEYEQQLASADEQLTPLLICMQSWAEAHPDLFGKAKSLDMVHGTIGWRTDPPSLKLLSGWTWKKVVERLRALRWRKFISLKFDINKKEVLARRAKLAASQLRQFGCKIEQDDVFFIEPKMETMETRETI